MKHKQYMEMALELAARGFGNVEPNPMVGCVIVDADGNVIGSGWHKTYGKEHAEINALADCRKRGHNPAGATMCVTLEPCCHHGKTPPCAEAIIKAGISKVVIAMLDPSDKVAGKGVKMLEDAGIKVSIGLCEKKARLLNPAFIKHSTKSLPWVVLKWAQTIDGKLSAAGLPEDQRWISNEASRKDVHKLRRSCQGILVGIETALIDDPLLTARPAKSRTPLRIVVDSKFRIRTDLKMFGTIQDADLLIVTTKKAFDNDMEKASKIVELGAEVLAVDADDDGRCDLHQLLENLGKSGVQRLLVEGGAKVISSFIGKGIADEAVVYIAPKLFASLGDVNMSDSLSEIKELPQLFDTTTGIFDGDVKFTGNFRRHELI
ncbi:MAG: bifunctional diaminohydroxyphosphoribosylaminopyrimidine deaminase/5-amino-6-(5-phosphoribosylamino)uracil reductase RibD [Sedimentisphaeraceae bacterium JB056]